jgi:hypothetical protein
LTVLLILVTAATLTLGGCNRIRGEPGKYSIAYQTGGLPDLTLTDQYGHGVSLASLRQAGAIRIYLHELSGVVPTGNRVYEADR